MLGLGAELNTLLAEEAGLRMVAGAVAVNFQLCTSAPDIWSAGDIIHFTDPLFGPRHIEHVDNAWQSGRTAGQNMAGESVAYDYPPLFYSDLFDDGYEAIGHLSTRSEAREVWNDDHSAAVVWYVNDGQVTGVLLWNTWDSVPRAREVVVASQSGQLSVEELAAQIAPGS